MSDFMSNLPTIGTVVAAAIAAIAAAYAARTAANISHANKIAEFRQAWIDALRQDIADYCAASETWMRKWDELNTQVNVDQATKAHRERTESLPLSISARTVLNRIRLRLNPRENPDKAVDDKLLASLLDLLDPGKLDPRNPDSSWRRMSDDAVEQAREILKREWGVTKQVIAVRTVRFPRLGRRTTT